MARELVEIVANTAQNRGERIKPLGDVHRHQIARVHLSECETFQVSGRGFAFVLCECGETGKLVRRKRDTDATNPPRPVFLAKFLHVVATGSGHDDELE